MSCSSCAEVARQRDAAEARAENYLATIQLVKTYVKLALDENRRDMTNDVAVRMIHSHIEEVVDE